MSQKPAEAGPEAERNRAKTLTVLANDRELIFAPHFPFPGVGYIEKDGDHSNGRRAENPGKTATDCFDAPPFAGRDC